MMARWASSRSDCVADIRSAGGHSSLTDAGIEPTCRTNGPLAGPVPSQMLRT